MKKNKKSISRIKFCFFLIISILLIYNPISARCMTLGMAVISDIDVAMFYKLIKTESSFRSLAYSSQKAIGLGQVQQNTFNYILPEHPKFLIWFPPTNLYASSKYLNYLNLKFDSNWSLTLAAYNWGETNVQNRFKKISIIPEKDYRDQFKDIPETYSFLKNILGDKK